MPLLNSKPNTGKASSAGAKKTAVETDVSSDNNSTVSDDWDSDDDDDGLGPPESASTSTVSNNQARVPPVTKKSNLPGRTGMDSQTPGWASNGLNGRSLAHNHGRRYASGPDKRRAHKGPYQPSYEPPQEHPLNASLPPMGYPSNDVRYPTNPDMQGTRPPGGSSGAQTRPYGYQSAIPSGFYQQQYAGFNEFNPRAAPGFQTPMYPTPQPPPQATPPPRPRTPIEDPEKIRLEAEIAAFKAMEERQKAAEKQKEVEAQIRKEAEEAFHRRMEDMRIAQEEAKKEIEMARLHAEQEATKRMQAEKNSEEERSKRFKEFAERLKRDVRAQAESEKMAEMAEREAKAKQSEDLERLVKLKLLKSMDEIVVLAKNRVLHDVTTQREMSVGATEKQGWLINTRGETEGENNPSRNDDLGEKSQTSVTQSNRPPPRHAKATTVRSVLSASVRRPEVSPTGSRTGPPLAVPDPPAFGCDSDDEGTLGRADRGTLDPSESGCRGRAHHRQQGIYSRQRHRDMYQNSRTQGIEALVDQIADAVMDRLMQSPYKDALIGPPPQNGQYYRRHLRPTRDPFDVTLPYGAFDREDTAGRFHKDGRKDKPSRRFFRPPKPAHLRGRSIRGSDGLSFPGMPPDTRPASPIAPSNSHTSTPRRPPPPPVSSWLRTSGTRDRFGTVSDYSEVDTAIQESSAAAVRRASAGSDESTWDHPDTWMDERPIAATHADGTNLREELEKINGNNLKAHLSQQEHEEDLEKAYRHIFEDPKSLPRELQTNLER